MSRLGAIFVYGSCVAAAHALLGCGSGGAGSALFVDLRTDLTPGAEFAAVETTVTTAGGERFGPVTVEEVAGLDARAGVRVAQLDDVPSAEVTIELRLLDEAGQPVAVERAVGRFDDAAVVTIVVRRSCVGVTCPGPGVSPQLTACLGGRCVRPECAAGDAPACDRPPVPLDDVPRLLAEAMCGALEDCNGAWYDTRFVRGDCVESIAADTRARSADAWLASITSGETNYRPEHAPACLDAIRALGCDLITLALDEHDECVLGFGGNVSEGGSCWSDISCAGLGSVCAGAGCPKRCTARLRRTQRCAGDSFCQRPLRCIGGVCANAAAVGAECHATDPTVAPPCEAGAQCFGWRESAPGRCRALDAWYSRLEGEPCDAIDGPMCARGLSCVVESGREHVCRPRPLRSGSACRAAFPDICPVGEVCDADPLAGRLEGSCVPLPPAGEPCFEATHVAPICASGAVCIDGACVAYVDNGGDCPVSELACRSSSCERDRCEPPPCGG